MVLNNQKKLLALDIDGTLADSQFRISQENIHWLRIAKENVYVLLTSTRPYRQIVDVAEKIGLDQCFIVGMAGCDIREYPSGKILYQRVIPNKNLFTLTEFAKKYQYYIQFFNMDGDYYFSHFQDYSIQYEKFMGYPGKLFDPKCYEMEIGKALYITEVENLEKLTKDLELFLPNNLRAEKVWKNIVEIFDSIATKGIAVRCIADRLGITRENIISMGDEEVDISMFLESGLAVAVSNARDVVKQYADIVTVSNDENAVAEVIKKYILDEERG